MKILLINPPLTVYKGGINPRIFLPIGLLYIAAQLKKEGHDVKIFDALLGAKLSDKDPTGNRQFGESWNDIARVISDYGPGMVGISSLFSSQSRNVSKIAQITKSVNRNIITVVGGPNASARPNDTAIDMNFDFVVIGEGEFTLPKIVNSIEKKMNLGSINGLCVKYNGRTTGNLNPDRIKYLDSLPLPAYELYDMERYFYLQAHGYCARPIGYGKREISIITSRGCPHNCVFCSIHPGMGKTWRAHSAEYVFSHVEYLVNKYNVDLIHIEDDNFSMDKKRFVKIMDRLASLRPGIKWDPPNGLRADSLDEEAIKKAVASGCQYIVIAIESGVQRVLDEIIDKKLRLEKVMEIAGICKRLDIELYAYYVIGFPGETIKEIKATLSYARKMLLKYFIYPQPEIASPIFGSRLYNICADGGYFADKVTPETLALAYYSYGKGLIKTDEFSPDILKSLMAGYNRQFTLIMIINILRRPRRLLKYLVTLMRNRHLFKRLIFNE